MPHSKKKELTSDQKSKLAKHAKGKSANHMAIMRRLMMRGFSFKQAHAMATKMERTPHREKPAGQRQSQRIVINMGGGRSTRANPRGAVQPFVGSVNNSDTLFNQMSAAVEQARARQNTEYNQRQNLLRNATMFRQDINTPNPGVYSQPMNYYSEGDSISRQRAGMRGAYQAGTLSSLSATEPITGTEDPTDSGSDIFMTGAPAEDFKEEDLTSRSSLPPKNVPRRNIQDVLASQGLRRLRGETTTDLN